MNNIKSLQICFKKSINRLAIVFLGLFIAFISAMSAVPSSALGTSQPTVQKQFQGYYNAQNSPPSSVIAASPYNEVQLLNTGYNIVNRLGNGQSGTLNSFVNQQGVFLSDPQILWDSYTNRFYFSIMENAGTSSPNEGIVWGYSKTASPSSPTDFCTYFNNFNYGSVAFPDRQSLGDSANYLLIGDNRYSLSNGYFLGSDLAWISKPAAGSTSCQTQSSFKTGVTSLHNADGSNTYLPVPARQVDASTTDYVLSTPSYVSANTLSQFTVNTGGTNGVTVSAAQNISVPTYSYPPYASQAGNTLAGTKALPLETIVYLSQVTMSYDPRLGHNVLWTDHTVAGGYGTAVRWYEINPSKLALDQVGTISSGSYNVFNASISPDRLVSGPHSAYGNNAVIEFNTSSLAQYPAIQMISIKNGQVSPMVTIQKSLGPNVDFTCNQPNIQSCRWGDYTGTAPDPGASLRYSSGGVWMTNQWNVANIDDQTPVWRTIIWRATP
ncbi:MAG TPA: hypothetical protein VLF79_00085 [Candidatus Saccharimonadales bacterium]|nr:hypothetical protein [Candidatus Saccharimonadales bacterium]